MPKVTRQDLANLADRAKFSGQYGIADDLHAILGRMDRTFGADGGYDREESQGVAENRGFLRSLSIVGK